MSNILRKKKGGEYQKFAKKVSIIIVAFNSDKYVKFSIEKFNIKSHSCSVNKTVCLKPL